MGAILQMIFSCILCVRVFFNASFGEICIQSCNSQWAGPLFDGLIYKCVTGLKELTPEAQRCFFRNLVGHINHHRVDKGDSKKCLGHFSWHGSTLIPVWISDHIRYEVCGMKLLIHSQAATVQMLKFGDGWVISFHNLLGMWLLINAGIKINSRQ